MQQPPFAGRIGPALLVLVLALGAWGVAAPAGPYGVIASFGV